MEDQKAINLFLQNGTAKGIIICKTDNWIGISYKIPKNKINEAKNIKDLTKIGLYFLFGKNKENQQTIYVGQANCRKNGAGVLGRILEPHSNKNNSDIDDWTEAIIFTTKDESFNGTKISYLENRFYNLAKIANRYYVKNGNEPNSDNVSPESRIELEKFVEYVKLFTEILGHKVFEPITEDEIISNQVNESSTSENRNDKIPKETQQKAEIPVNASIKETTLKDITFSKELKLAYFEIFGKRYTVKRARDIYPELVKIFVEKYSNSCTYKDNKFVLEKSNFKLELYKKEDLPTYANSKHICNDYHLNTHGDMTKVETNIRKIVSLMGISEDKIIIGYYQKSVSGKDWKEEPNFSAENIKIPIINNNDDDLLYMTYKEADAKCRKTKDGFLVLKDSKINPIVQKSCPTNIIKLREEYKDKNKIDSSCKLKEDILFASSSAAAGFVAGFSCNGNDVWKDKNGKSLKELEQQ